MLGAYKVVVCRQKLISDMIMITIGRFDCRHFMLLFGAQPHGFRQRSSFNIQKILFKLSLNLDQDIDYLHTSSKDHSWGKVFTKFRPKILQNIALCNLLCREI